jgi:hypothetical protein
VELIKPLFHKELEFSVATLFPKEEMDRMMKNSKDILPICSLESRGDFYWNSDLFFGITGLGYF